MDHLERLVRLGLEAPRKKIDYSVFLELARLPTVDGDPETEHDWSRDVDIEGEADRFIAVWAIEGTINGAWSDEPIAMTPDPEPELHRLLYVLDDLDVRLRHVRAILAGVATGYDYLSGYYLTTTKVAWKQIPFTAVYDKLVEFGYAVPRRAAG